MTPEQIEAAKKSIILTGRVSEWHVEHLKKWPFVVFNGLKEAKVSWSFPSLPAFDSEKNLSVDDITTSVTFDLLLEEDAVNPELEKRKEALTQWVRSIFFENTKVIFVGI